MCLEEFVDENGTVPSGVSGVPVVSGNCVLRSCDYMRVSVLLLSVLTLYFIGRIDYELDRRIHKRIIVVTVTITVQIYRHSDSYAPSTSTFIRNIHGERKRRRFRHLTD